MLIAELFTISKIWKQPKCPSIDDWIKNLWHLYTMEQYSTIKKNEILHLVTAWIDLESIGLSEISQTEKDKDHDFTCIWNVKNKIEIYSQIENRVSVDRG